jgi:hypothetical protein
MARSARPTRPIRINTGIDPVLAFQPTYGEAKRDLVAFMRDAHHERVLTYARACEIARHHFRGIGWPSQIVWRLLDLGVLEWASRRTDDPLDAQIDAIVRRKEAEERQLCPTCRRREADTPFSECQTCFARRIISLS